MQIPFTTTFSKIPSIYIPTNQSSEIIENFSYENPSESVYKITGVRGSGKTVLLAKIEEEFNSKQREDEGWIVCSLTVNRDMLQQMAALLSKKGFIKDKKISKSAGLSANILGAGANVQVTSDNQNGYFDVGIELDEALKELTQKGNKVLIGIDEVSKTKDMLVFAAEFGKWIREGYSVYLVCTGLYDNIEQVANVNNLTFFRRATTIKMENLNFVRMTEAYKKQLDVNMDEAKELSRLTQGYAYAFQELGILYFKSGKKHSIDEICSDLKSELFAYAYEKIWEELTEEDKELLRLIIDKKDNKREDIISKMKKPNNYSVYRDRLLKRGIITARQAYISLALPFFDEYIKEYGM